MKFCVCKNKDDGDLFITTRAARETMINVLLNLGQQPYSIVLKEADDYTAAQKYMSDLKAADQIINKTNDTTR